MQDREAGVEPFGGQPFEVEPQYPPHVVGTQTGVENRSNVDPSPFEGWPSAKAIPRGNQQGQKKVGHLFHASHN